MAVPAAKSLILRGSRREHPSNPRGGRRICNPAKMTASTTLSVILLVAAIVLCFAASWILLPPFILGLVPLTVGVPELSPWLLTAALVTCALAYRWSAFDQTARAALYSRARERGSLRVSAGASAVGDRRLRSGDAGGSRQRL